MKQTKGTLPKPTKFIGVVPKVSEKHKTTYKNAELAAKYLKRLKPQTRQELANLKTQHLDPNHPGFHQNMNTLPHSRYNQKQITQSGKWSNTNMPLMKC